MKAKRLLPWFALCVGLFSDARANPPAKPADTSPAAGNSASQKRKHTFLAGKGVEGAFELGDREEKFIDWIGPQTLIAREFAAFRSGGEEQFIAYEDNSRKWLVHVRKSSRRIAQIFFCGTNWRTPGGFGPSRSYPSHRAEFGPVRNMDFAMVVHAEKGIGFKDSRELEEVDSRGIRVKSLTYGCVTVFVPWTNEPMDFSDWSGM